MALLWDSNNFPQGEGRYDIQLGAIAQLGKEFVSFFAFFFLGSILTLAASNLVLLQAGWWTVDVYWLSSDGGMDSTAPEKAPTPLQVPENKNGRTGI